MIIKFDTEIERDNYSLLGAATAALNHAHSENCNLKAKNEELEKEINDLRVQGRKYEDALGDQNCRLADCSLEIKHLNRRIEELEKANTSMAALMNLPDATS